MKFKTLSGREKYKNIQNRKIDWSKPSRSKIQTAVKSFLFKFWQYDLVFEEMPVLGTRNTLDIVNITKKIAIEVHGSQHIKYNSFFHRNRNDFRTQLERDLQKQEWCRINNLTYIDIYEKNLPLTKDWFYQNFSIYL
jgi:hypothetical protein